MFDFQLHRSLAPLALGLFCKGTSPTPSTHAQPSAIASPSSSSPHLPGLQVFTASPFNSLLNFGLEREKTFTKDFGR